MMHPGEDRPVAINSPPIEIPFDLLAESLPQLLWAARPDGHLDYFNGRWYDYTGMTAEESRGPGWSRALHPEDRGRAEARWGLATATGEAYEIEYRLRRRDGAYRWFLGRALPAVDGGGRVIRWSGTCTDIDDLKRAGEALGRERESFRLTLASIGEAVIVTDPRGRVTFLNGVAETLTGWPAGEASGLALPEVFRIVNEASREPAEDPVARVIRSGKDLGLANHTVLIARDGREAAIDDSAAPILDADGGVAGVILVFRDIGERRAEEIAAEERGRLTAFAAESGQALTRDRALPAMLRDCCEGMVRHLGAAFARIWTVDDEGKFLELKASAGCYTQIDGAHARVPVGRDKIGRIARDRAPHLTNDVPNDPRVGDPGWARREGIVAFAGYPLLVEDRLVGVMALFARRRLTRATLAAMETVADGVAVGIERKRVEARRTELFVAERSARVAAETARAQAEAARAEAESAGRSKDRFLAMLSHELRTPLTPVLLTATALLDDPSTPPEIRPAWEMVRHNIGLEARLIDDLLDVMKTISGKMPYHFEVVDAHDLIRQALEIVRSDIHGKGLRLATELGAGLSHVKADPARMTQALWNLVKNSVKFTAEGGGISVRTRNEGDRLIVEVADTGIGIEPAALVRIFNAFEQVEDSVTRQYGGLGLGLAISKSVVDSHQGTLRATSPGPGRGATFIIDLITVAPLAEDRAGRAPGVVERRPFAILLVEDDAMTCRVMATLLRNAGHSVTTASSYSTALAVASADFDLVISDVGLPERNGFELMRELRARHGLLGIALTGFGLDEDIRKGRDAGFIIHMTKPVDFAKLDDAIQTVGQAAESWRVDDDPGRPPL